MSKVLVLNASYEPLNITSWRRAVVLLLKGKAEQLEHNGHFIYTDFPFPTVIRLRHFVESRMLRISPPRASKGKANDEEDKVKSAQNGLSQGVGVRVISGAKVGYAYSDDLDEEALLRAARTAAFIAQGGGSEKSFNVTRTPLPTFYRLDTHLADVDVAKKRDLVVRANKTARAYDKRIKQVMCTWADSTKKILVANTVGHLAEDTQDMCRLSTMVVAEGKKNERRTGSYGGGGQVDITNGNFVFEVSEAYELKKGKLGRPLKGVTLIGVGPEALKNVSRVGNDPKPDPGMGTCGKDGQSVPVGVGLPTLRIDNMTVGGTKVGGKR